MRLWTRSLRARLIGHFSLLSLAIVALAGALAFVGARRALEDSVVQRLTVFSTLQEDQLRRWVEHAREGVVYMASLPEVRSLSVTLLRDGISAPIRDRLHGYLDSGAGAQHDFEEIFILADAGGRIVFSTDPEQEGEYRVRDRFFTEGRQRTYVQNVYPSPMTIEPTLTISTPLEGPAGEPLGVFAAHLDLVEIDRIIDEPAGLGETGETYLVDAYNDFISGTRFGRDQYPRGVHTEGIDDAVAGRDGAALYLNYEGTPVIGVYRWIEDLELALLVEVAQEEAFAPAREIAWLILGLGLGLGALLTAATFLLARQIVGPVTRLTKAAVEVAGGDLAIRVPVLTDDEIGVLARTFNEMTGELRAVYDGLEAKNAELERFNYTVSHDLRNPLVTIRGFLGLVEKDAAAGDQERLRQDLDQIRKATELMARLIHDLLELSRVGRALHPPKDVDLDRLVGEATELLAGPIDQRRVEIVIAPDLPAVRGDRTRLLEVFQNLIDNAVTYMGDASEPQVEIGAREDGEGVVCFVRDNGIGIEPRYQEKIFDLFERLDVSVEGTGVGLALVKRIVETHGGRVWVESDGKDRGSTFYFTLEAAAARPPPEAGRISAR